ncbi:hypothetical protein EDD11_008542 [Mortierella claussenii]|nr:hypothetical protein EDD11_008542 [Mortierella claussenii]
MINIGSSLLLAGIAVLVASYTSSVDADTSADKVLMAHNAARAQYGAGPLTYDAGLQSGALQFAQQCNFSRSNTKGQYGENIYASSVPSASIDMAVAYWMSQASKYNYNRPGFSLATGGFTQVVWNSTASVACARVNCPPDSVLPQPSVFIVCHYTPPGNFPGQFPQNVGHHV